jgi:hypothetical protein
MRIGYIITAAALAVITAAKPHHMHHRVHVRGPIKRGTIFLPAAVEIHIVYWLEDHAISEEEVREGIANGTLMWGNDGALSTSTSSPVALPTSPPASKQQIQVADPTPEPAPKESVEKPESIAPEPKKPAPPPEMPSSNPAPSPSQNAPPIQQSSTSRPWADMVDENGHCAECDKDFPNGKIRCTEFPYGYGALPIAHEGLGGWSGIQDPQYAGADGFDDITTVVKGSCSDGTCCTSGSFCSYGCPNPYLKASFPSIQGRTGQSVGGLYCNEDGFLEMADGKIANSLCVQGSKRMGVKVQNKLSKSVSFCRTDYPGMLYAHALNTFAYLGQALSL